MDIRRQPTNYSMSNEIFLVQELEERIAKKSGLYKKNLEIDFFMVFILVDIF